jgi:hypothetical protein
MKSSTSREEDVSSELVYPSKAHPHDEKCGEEVSITKSEVAT